jgi:hypothetical protein
MPVRRRRKIRVGLRSADMRVLGVIVLVAAVGTVTRVEG